MLEFEFSGDPDAETLIQDASAKLDEIIHNLEENQHEGEEPDYREDERGTGPIFAERSIFDDIDE